ncbi:hypothetical protein TYRP_001515 [Tyrophagus putrescentiae]|nr:hypothetical protein TYRP_001515 [Tyrophagus putrescentiae]
MLALLRSAYVRDQMEAIKPQAFKPAFARNVTEFTQSVELDSIEVFFPMNTIVGGSNCRASLLFIRRCFPRPGWWADVCSLRCQVDP